MKPLFLPLMVAIAGAASLALLVPRFDPAASLHAVLDRHGAFVKTRQLAGANGENIDGWKTLAVETLDQPTGPLKIRTAMITPDGKRYLQAAWYADGRLAWSRLPGQPGAGATDTVHVSGADDGDRPPKVEVKVGDQSSAREKLVYLPVRILDVLWRIAVVVYSVVAAFRRRLRYRAALILTIVLAVWAAGAFWGGTGYQKTQIVRASVNRMLASGSGDIDVNVGGSMQSGEPSRGAAVFWLFVFVAAGIAVRGLDNHRKWYTVELVTRSGFFSRDVGRAVATGLMSGLGIAAIPYWIAASGLFRGSVLVFRSAEALVAPVPALVAWNLGAGALAAGIFGFSFPLLARMRYRALRWGLFGVVGIAALGPHVTPFSTQGANLFTAVLLFGAYLLLYLKTDLLATMVAMVAAQAALAPCFMLVQPGGAVRVLALPLLLIWALALAGSLRFAVRGREGEDLPVSSAVLDPVEEGNTKTGRMRLHAEFEVARKAQEDALPTSPPAVEGYSIAGSCEPAQQVGGDLYDYFSLADGRLGIAVADVSGKGVPAALYMMVTKGLLAATTRDSSDLAYILQQINRHLYTACKKKVFVTLAAVALDPVARRLQHGRAGHNPILWRRAALGETVVLKPPGLGLGMTPGERFNRSLKIEELQLQEGDAIVLYSDGITEAVNATMDQFGEERLIRAVESVDGRPAEESRTAILRDLAAFTNGTPARDDVTLVVLRVAQNGVLT